MTFDRRGFLACLGTAVLPLAGCRRRAAPTATCAASPPLDGPARILDGPQRATLRAACSRLLPGDGEPGADEARVVDFIEAQLAAPPVAGFRGELTQGLRQLDVLAQRYGNRSFASLRADEQDQLLRQLQRGMPMARRYDSKHFFLVLLTITLEGFLCDPVYGGNRGEAGWRFIGFLPRPPRPRCPYRSAG
jgi:gluconate 2-dehydrogenase gamma chain